MEPDFKVSELVKKISAETKPTVWSQCYKTFFVSSSLNIIKVPVDYLQPSLMSEGPYSQHFFFFVTYELDQKVSV